MSESIINKDYQKALAAFLADPATTIQQLLDEDQVAASIYIWLAKLKLLHGVPFRYLVPDERMLPPESIKFFNLDLNWVNALVDGAFSIGNHAAKNVENQTMMHKLSDLSKPLVARQANNAARNTRPKAFKLSEVTNKDPFAPVTGFLLRSEVVSGWKGLQVTAFDKDHYPGISDENNVKYLKTLRLEHLSDTLILALFEGQAYRVDIHEPSEGLHFGFDLDSTGQLSKNLRDPAEGKKIPDHSISHEDLISNGVFRAYGNPDNSGRNAGGQVINMHKMSHLLYQSLGAAGKGPNYKEPVPSILQGKDQKPVPIVTDASTNPLVSSDFALQMIEGRGMVSFYNASPEDEVACKPAE